MRFLWISPLLKTEEKNQIEDIAKQFFPGARITQEKEISQVHVLKQNEVALVYKPSAVSLSPLAFKQCTKHGIDPFEWNFPTKTRMNFFLRNKRIMLIGFDEHAKRHITHMIHQMDGTVCGTDSYADYAISPKQIKVKDRPDCTIVSSNWIESLYVSNFLVDFSQFTFSKKNIKAKMTPNSKKINAIKSPREIAKELESKKKEEIVIKLQLKEKTPDIMAFFTQKEIPEKAVQKSTKIIKSPLKSIKNPLPDNPFQQPNTDTMQIDEFLENKDNKTINSPSNSPNQSPRAAFQKICKNITNLTVTDTKSSNNKTLHSLFEKCVQFTQNFDSDLELSDEISLDEAGHSQVNDMYSQDTDPLMLALE